MTTTADPEPGTWAARPGALPPDAHLPPDSADEGVSASVSRTQDHSVVINVAVDRGDAKRTLDDQVSHAILEGLPVGVFVVDASGSPYYANPMAVRLLGKGVDPASGPDDLAEAYQAFVTSTEDPYPSDMMPMVQALSGQTTHVDDMEIRRPSGPITVEVWGHPIVDSEARVTHGAAVFADITGRKLVEAEIDLRAEQMAEVNAELQRSNADLDAFAHVASHDLSEPLRSISGFVQLLAKRYEGKLDDDADRFIRRTIEGTERMQALITDLLAYSAVGRTSESFDDVDCNELLRATVEALAGSIRDGEVVVGDLPVVWGDRARLSQLFQNLLTNAIKFVPAGVAPRVEVAASRIGGTVEFSISDNGIGIETQYRERIFRMFQRLNRREEFGGTGIGLAVCKKIVERHGGRIWVHDNPCGGADFRFTLPPRRARN